MALQELGCDGGALQCCGELRPPAGLLFDSLGRCLCRHSAGGLGGKPFQQFLQRTRDAGVPTLGGLASYPLQELQDQPRVSGSALDFGLLATVLTGDFSRYQCRVDGSSGKLHQPVTDQILRFLSLPVTDRLVSGASHYFRWYWG